MHFSPCLVSSPSKLDPHALRLHILPLGIDRDGSSSSDSGGGGGGVAIVCGAAIGALPGTGASIFDGVTTFADEPVSVPCFFSTSGGISVVLCLPVVQGGIVRNSSNVSTRGLQHFHPVFSNQYILSLNEPSLPGIPKLQTLPF